MWISGTSRASQSLWHTVNNIDFRNSVTCLQICTTCRTSQASSTILLKSLESQDSTLYFFEWHKLFAFSKRNKIRIKTHMRTEKRKKFMQQHNSWMKNLTNINFTTVIQLKQFEIVCTLFLHKEKFQQKKLKTIIRILDLKIVFKNENGTNYSFQFY